MSAAVPVRATRFVAVTIFIDAIGFGIIGPVLPTLVMHLTHGTLADATRLGGWLWLAFAVMQFLCGPLVGGLGDRFGRRPVLLGALGGFAIDYLIVAFAPTIAWLFAGRLLGGVFGASYGPAMAALADTSTGDERAKAFGWISAAFGIGFVVGPAIGGLLGQVGPRAPFIAAAILSGCNFLYGFAFFPETLPPERRRRLEIARLNPLGAFRAIGRAGPVLPVLAAYFFWQLAIMVYPVTWPFYAIASFGWSSALIGGSLALSGGIMALIQFTLVGRTVARFGERGAAMLGLAAAAIVFAGYAVTRSSVVAYVLVIVSGLQSFVQPSLMAIMSRTVPADQQGELQGLNGSVAALAAILAPLVLAEPLAYFTGPDAPVYFPGAAFCVSVAMALVAILILGIARRQPVAA